MLLPLQALNLLLKNFKLMALAFFPGAVTFIGSAVAAYYAWTLLFSVKPLWVGVPGTILVWFLGWLIVGNLSLIPVEDWIVDEVQRMQLGTVKFPAPNFSVSRVFSEIGFSLLIAAMTVAFFFLSFIPALWPIAFAFAAWFTSYGFLATLYNRSAKSIREKIYLYKKDWFTNLCLGAFLNILLFVPIVNVFLLGYALILSTLVYLKRRQ
jgi:hypothetical protein